MTYKMSLINLFPLQDIRTHNLDIDSKINRKVYDCGNLSNISTTIVGELLHEKGENYEISGNVFQHHGRWFTVSPESNDRKSKSSISSEQSGARSRYQIPKQFIQYITQSLPEQFHDYVLYFQRDTTGNIYYYFAKSDDGSIVVAPHREDGYYLDQETGWIIRYPKQIKSPIQLSKLAMKMNYEMKNYTLIDNEIIIVYYK